MKFSILALHYSLLVSLEEKEEGKRENFYDKKEALSHISIRLPQVMFYIVLINAEQQIFQKNVQTKFSFVTY